MRLNIRVDDDLHRRIRDAVPHGLQEALLKNLIKMALDGKINPSHIAVDQIGEYEIVKKKGVESDVTPTSMAASS